MKSLVEFLSPTLEWLKSVSTPTDFELRGHAGVFATLTFLDEQCTLARIKTAEGTWTLKHLGILTPAVTLREEGGKTNLATYHPHTLRPGQLQFEDGAFFDWMKYHDGGVGGTFLDPGGLPMVRLHAHAGKDPEAVSSLESCDVDLNQASIAPQRHALLAAFGWFLILFDHLKDRDDVPAETALRL